MDVPAGSVVITPTDLYNEVKAIGQNVTSMRGDIEDIKTALPDHESRIRLLEKKVWWATGLAAGAGAGLTQLLQALGKA
jgi:hypothetical protein